MNKWIGIGNLAADPDMRYTPSGVPVTNMRMAVNERWTNADGTTGEKVTWVQLTAWRSLAETCAKYLLKGHKVGIVGKIDGANAWTDREGNTQATVQITVQELEFLTPKSGGSNGSGQPAQNEGKQTAPSNDVEDKEYEEDIPF